MDVYRKLASLLESEDARRRIAAAVVPGELKVKDAAVVSRLVEMAREPLEPYATAALEALPVMLEALGRGGEVAATAGKALSALGPDALPELRAHLQEAPPEVKARIDQLLPAVGGRLSFEMTLEGMRGQPWEVVNRVALSVRQEMKTASAADRKVLRTQVHRFLEKKKTLEEEPALRGALKVLGYLELQGNADDLLGYTTPKFASAVRTEAATALRFALSAGATKNQLKRLIDLLEDKDPLLARATRDTLTVLPLDASLAEEFARLCHSPDNEVAKWAISALAGLGAQVAGKTLVPVAGGEDRVRAEAAVAALSGFGGASPGLLVQGLCTASHEVGAHLLAEALLPVAKKLSKKELGKVEAAGVKALEDSFALGRRVLEPLREASPERWTKVISEAAGKFKKKDPARSAALLDVLAESSTASPEDRHAHAVMLLLKSPLDIHPRSGQRDGCLPELERLAGSGFDVGCALLKGKAESTRGAAGSLGMALLEHLVKKSPSPFVLLALCVVFSCSGGGGQGTPPRVDGGVRDAGPPPDGGPITAPEGEWTWVPVDGSRCGSGARAGLGINRADGGEELLLFLQGGGACWNAGTCAPSPQQYGPLCDYGQLCLLDTAGGLQPTATFVEVKDPFPADGGGAWPSQFATVKDSLLFDRSLPDNPFRDATFVFVPYCTGDLHGGDGEQVYASHVMHFWGARNMDAYLQRLQVTLPDIRRVWLMGASAGGYGAQLNLERVRRAFPNAEVHLLADSAPLIRSVHFQKWKEAWNLQLPDGCDAGLPDVAAHLLETYPDSRQALLSYDEDRVIAWYFLAGPGLGAFLAPPVDTFRAELAALQSTYDSSESGGTFRIPGTEHVLFGGYGMRRPDGGTTAPFPSRDGGTNLRAWVNAWAAADGGWR